MEGAEHPREAEADRGACELARHHADAAGRERAADERATLTGTERAHADLTLLAAVHDLEVASFPPSRKRVYPGTGAR